MRSINFDAYGDNKIGEFARQWIESTKFVSLDLDTMEILLVEELDKSRVLKRKMEQYHEMDGG